jgi:hypothetical protein
MDFGIASSSFYLSRLRWCGEKSVCGGGGWGVGETQHEMTNTTMFCD